MKVYTILEIDSTNDLSALIDECSDYISLNAIGLRVNLYELLNE